MATPKPMRILIDTDAFCKLSIGGVLADFIDILGETIEDCGRLPALPHMLKRGRLLKLFGPDACNKILPIAESLPVIAQPSDDWLEKLRPYDAIDPGEAQIFAVAAEFHMLVVSGDKRALRELKQIEKLRNKLNGRIVVMEAALLVLCESLGVDEVRERVQPLRRTDQVAKVCFSSPRSDPRDGLRSYFDSLVRELDPLVLWSPRSGGEA